MAWLKLPGDEALRAMCNSARQVVTFCDLVGLTPEEQEIQLRARGILAGSRDELVADVLDIDPDDPDDRPYIWEL